MNPDELKIRNFEKELFYSASRSSGPGGQNVNKLNTKAELRFSVISTLILTEDEQAIVFRKLKKKINKNGELVIMAQTGRTQIENKSIVTEKFYKLISTALTLPKIRKPTKPTLSGTIKRLDNKKNRSKIKRFRRDETVLNDID